MTFRKQNYTKVLNQVHQANNKLKISHLKLLIFYLVFNKNLKVNKKWRNNLLNINVYRSKRHRVFVSSYTRRDTIKFLILLTCPKDL